MRRRKVVGIAGGGLALYAGIRQVMSVLADIADVPNGVQAVGDFIGAPSLTIGSMTVTAGAIAFGIGLVMLSKRVPASEQVRRAKLEAIDVSLPDVLELSIKLLRTWTRECGQRFGGGSKNLALVALKQVVSRHEARLETHQSKSKQIDMRRLGDEVDRMALSIYGDVAEIRLWIERVRLELPERVVAQSNEYAEWRRESEHLESHVTALWGNPQREAIVAVRAAEVPAYQLFRR